MSPWPLRHGVKWAEAGSRTTPEHRSCIGDSRSGRNEFIDVAIWCPELLPGRAAFTKQFHPCGPQLGDGFVKIAHRETDDWTGLEVVFAGVVRAEHFDVAAVWKAKDPESWFGMHRP